jgi:predicted phosphoribosyltransferase
MRFASLAAAGAELAAAVGATGILPEVVLTPAIRGVPIAAAVGTTVGCQWDLLEAVRIAVPGGSDEVAVGALVAGELRLDGRVLTGAGVADSEVLAALPAARRSADRLRRLRGGREPTDVAGRRVLLVDDGIGSGVTMRAAVAHLQQVGAALVAVAVPVAPREAVADLRTVLGAEAMLALSQPLLFRSVRWAYDDFTAPDDETVRTLLAAGAAARAE